MLSRIDRTLKAWHVVALNSAAVAWFTGMMLVSQQALPNVSLARCPIGFCVTGYTVNSLTLAMRLIREDGRRFLLEKLLVLDRILPLLLLLAFSSCILWWTRPGARWSVPLESRFRYLLLAAPALYAIADYAENWAFAEILTSYPQITYRSVLRASVFTSAKSQLVAASIGIAAALALAAWVTGRRNGSNC